MTGISGVALARAADAVLRTMGASEVSLVFAAAGMPTDYSAELGLVDPGVEQVKIAPALVRELATENSGPRRRIEIVVGQGAMAEQISQRNVKSAEVLFNTALGVVYAGEMFCVEGFTIERFAGVPCLYRVVAVE